MQPYIGITDFTHLSQVEDMLVVLKTHQKTSYRKLHVGVMMSYKTLHDIPSKWQNVFPPKETISQIFSSKESYNCLHYADYDSNPNLWQSLTSAINYGGQNLHALQLDMIWPAPNQVKKALLSSSQKVEIILQIGKNALEQLGDNPNKVVERLKHYEGCVHRVLLDKSMGKGLGMDAQALLPFATSIKKNFPNLGLGAAGGLEPETIELVSLLAKSFPDLSIDAQGRLRPGGSALDPVDWSMAKTYLIKAIKLFS